MRASLERMTEFLNQVAESIAAASRTILCLSILALCLGMLVLNAAFFTGDRNDRAAMVSALNILAHRYHLASDRHLLVSMNLQHSHATNEQVVETFLNAAKQDPLWAKRWLRNMNADRREQVLRRLPELEQFVKVERSISSVN